jgi:hypothetical protein
MRSPLEYEEGYKKSNTLLRAHLREGGNQKGPETIVIDTTLRHKNGEQDITAYLVVYATF